MKYAKDMQVARCGNAVPPPFAEALVRTNLPDMCLKKKALQHDKARFGGFYLLWRKINPTGEWGGEK